jgi:hypothetical protein
MTEEEVAEILGGPGMNGEEYHAQRKDKPPSIRVQAFSEPAGGSVHVGGGKTRCWIGHRGCIVIRFDAEGLVAFKYFEHLGYAEPSFIDRLRDWLGW